MARALAYSALSAGAESDDALRWLASAVEEQGQQRSAFLLHSRHKGATHIPDQLLELWLPSGECQRLELE